MTVYRFAINHLQKWAELPHRKPILMRGARQVGKTTLVKLLAEKDFELVTVDFEVHPELAADFACNKPDEIIEAIQAKLNVSVIPGKTLLFLDEIQGAPEAIAALRYFHEQLPKLHVIAAGSLLEFALKEASISMPVGRIEFLYLGPLTFEEFLLANHEKKLLNYLNNYTLNKTIPQSVHEKSLNLLKKYCLTGGMPEAVNHYVQHKNLTETSRIQHSIIDTYREDFGKYAEKKEIDLIKKTFNKIPRLLTQKIKYSLIDQHARSLEVASCITKLKLAKVIEIICHTRCNGLPLEAETNDKMFKSIFLDVGLVSTLLSLDLATFSEHDDLTLVNKGQIAEQFIGQQLLARRPLYEAPKLHYWVREKKSASSEVDYIINVGTKIIPIEVKAGKTGTLKSLHQFIAEKKSPLALRFNTHLPSIYCVDESSQLLSLPLYLVGQLERLVATFDKNLT